MIKLHDMTYFDRHFIQEKSVIQILKIYFDQALETDFPADEPGSTWYRTRATIPAY